MEEDHFTALTGASFCSVYAEVIYREQGKDWVS